MSHFLFAAFLVILFLLRFPLILLVWPFGFFNSFVQKRVSFEQKNKTDKASLQKFKADFCFEISSEGELEQVRPLLDFLFKKNKKVEIIYSSPSVEKKMQALFNFYPERIRLFRLPIFSLGSPLVWASAPCIVFCRYDFFPELLLLKLWGKKLILVSGAVKKLSWYKRASFNFFDIVVASTENEKTKFKKILKISSENIYSCDFRIPQIVKRVSEAEIVLSKKEILTSYLKKIKNISPQNKIIAGSFWPSDLEILNNSNLISDIKRKRLHLLIVPHCLDEESILAIKKNCDFLFEAKNVCIINEGISAEDAPVNILNMTGILCELYSFFQICYVGGGYERSIHSVLEPFFSNNFVVTGPRVERSTEYDLLLEIAGDEIHVLKNPESFYTIVKSQDVSLLNLEKRKDFHFLTLTQMENIFEKVFQLKT